MSRRLERKFAKPTLISKHLYCPICIEVYLDATRLFCGHTFCKKCITQWEADHSTCPECRVKIEPNLSGKDLIAEKIIQDLEVYCPNKLCDWKDRLENLTKHVNCCPYDSPPEWLKEAQSYINVEDDPTANDIFLKDNEQFIQRLNEEVPRKSLLERLYTKDLQSQQLVEGIFNRKKSVNKQTSTTGLGSLEHYNDLFGVIDDSDEEKENVEAIDEISIRNDKSQSTDMTIMGNNENIREKSRLDNSKKREVIMVDGLDVLDLRSIGSVTAGSNQEEIQFFSNENEVQENNGIQQKRVGKRRFAETSEDNPENQILKKKLTNPDLSGSANYVVTYGGVEEL